MKVLIFTTGYPRFKGDYANIYLSRLAKSLVKEKVETHVLAPHAPGIKKEEVIDEVSIHRFQYLFPQNFQTLAYFPGIPEKIRTFKGLIQLPFFFISALYVFLKTIKKYQIDVVNAHWATPLGFIAVLTKFFHHKPVVITLYGAELFPIQKNKNSLLRRFTKYAICHSDKTVGISDVTCNAGKEISKREDIEILPDGIDIDFFNPSKKPDKIIKKYNLKDKKIIFSSGRMVERKGFRYLVEAMPIILKNYPQTKLILGGDGPEKENLVCLANKLKIKNDILFPGFIPEKDFPLYMRASSVFVLPSIIDKNGDTEGSATILLEAMACETPVVGTKVGGVPFAVKENLGGFLVDQKNSQKLAEKILKLLKEIKLRNIQGKIGRNYVINNFGTKIIAKKYLQIFNKFN